MKTLKSYISESADRVLSVADIESEFSGFLGHVLGVTYTSVDVSGRERTWEVSGVNLASNLIQTSVPNGWVAVDTFKDVLLRTVENGGTVTATEPNY